jgi:hypothetical protein
MEIQLNYVFSNFNEAIIFVQELFEKIVFQKYFNIVYLGQTIQCSIEIEGNTQIQVNELDLSSAEPNRRTMEFNIKVCTNLPIIYKVSESSANLVINSTFTSNSNGNTNQNDINKIIQTQSVIYKEDSKEILGEYKTKYGKEEE